MKTRCITLALLLLFGTMGAKAQWVPISQSFADFIKTEISSTAISGNQLDTSNLDIISLTVLNINGSNVILDITGLQYFDALTDLYIESDDITFLPILPAGLTELTLAARKIANISDLPVNLNKLFIYFSGALVIDSFPPFLQELSVEDYTGSMLPDFPLGLTSLRLRYYHTPTPLPFFPDGLTSIDLSDSYVNMLPNIPTHLKYLNINRCSGITQLDATNFSALDGLDAWGAGIIDAGPFPDQMHTLDLRGNPLTNVTQLPSSVYSLNLSNSSISYIPTSDIQVTYLNLENCGALNIQGFLDKVDFSSGFNSCFIGNNGLTTVPHFRAGVLINALDMIGNPLQTVNLNSIPVSEYLNLSNCQLSELKGSQINLKQVYLDDNPLLACIPLIGNNVTRLTVKTTNVTCLPNSNNNPSFTCDPLLAVCQVPCASMPLITGKVFLDNNKDGLRDIGEGGIAEILVKLNGIGYIAKTDTLGNFKFTCPPGGPYTLQVFPTNAYSYISTPAVNLIIPNINPGDEDSLNDIGIAQILNVNDLHVKITPSIIPRPGFSLTYDISVVNLGTTTQTGTATFKFDPSLTFQSASSSGIQSGDSITWTFSNFLPDATLHYNAVFEVPATTPLGASLCARAIANGNMPDTTIYNNHDSICQTVIGSYDPNDKTAYPGEVLTKEQMLSGEGIDYVVRFQNTGTASAINVRVEDTISPLMEAATIRMIAASHVNEWRIDSGNVLKVFFNNINLPDSGANELLSHGFFRYSIKPKAGTNIGDSIKNTALIYFDFNAPIVTNTVKTDVTTLFATPIAPQTVCEGQPLNLSFTDNPAISKIEWLRNDTALGLFGASLNIPNATLAHSGQYSVKITLNNDAVFTSAKSAVTVNSSFIPSVSIAQTTQNACSGSLVSFAATPNNGGNSPAYQWFINGALNFSGGDVLSVTLNRNDEVKAVMTSSLSCTTTPHDTSNLLLAAMDTLATTSVSLVAPTGICEGQSAAITTVANNAGNAPEYQWSINGQIVQNANTATLTTTLQNNDVVAVKLISSLQCVTEDTVSATQNIATTAAVVPTIALSASAGNDVCNGSSQSFKVSATNQGQTPVYTWYLNGTVVSVLLRDSIQLSNLSDGDIVQAVLQSSATCATPAQVSSESDTVKVIPAPDKPTITQSGSTLTADALDGIQWLLNGTPVQGANSASYTAEVNGVYRVLVTDNNGCTALSDTIGMRILSLGSIDISQAISVYPNPFSSQVTLQLNADISADSWSYKLLNVSGQTILQSGISQNITTLNMEKIASGVYMLHVQGTNGYKAFRLVKY